MKYIRYICLLTSSLLAALQSNAQTTKSTLPMNTSQKVLVAYFSHSGNTRFVAEKIHSLIPGSDLFEIKTVHQYSTDYDTVVDEARTELRQKARPELAAHLQNADSYDVIFLGYPNWWSTYPMAVATFLEENNFGGKTIIPFCTHEGSRFGSSLHDLKQACPDSTIGQGITIRGGSVHSNTAHKDVEKWLQELNL